MTPIVPFVFSRRHWQALACAAGLAALTAQAAPPLPAVKLAPATPATTAAPATGAPGVVRNATAALMPVPVAQNTRYVILVDGGRAAGEQSVERDADGATRVHYAFRSDGLALEYDEQIQVAPDGTLAQYRASGSGPFGAKIDEQFSLNGNQAQWHSAAGGATRTVAGATFYMPLYGSPEVASISLAAMLRRPGGKLTLLPSGSLAQRKIDEQVATRSGVTQRVQLLVQSGPGLAPQLYWATVGAQPRLFARIIPGEMTIIEDGWQANEKLLAARQKLAEGRLQADLALRLQHPLSGLLAIRNVRVFDSEKAVLGAASDVYVLRGRIAAVLPAGTVSQGTDVELDGGGRVLLPGLFDLDGRVGRWDGALHLAAGVTTVRASAYDDEQLQQTIDEALTGKLLAPHIVATGLLDGEGAQAAGGGAPVRDLDGARNAIDWYAQHGYVQVNLGHAFPAALVRATAEHAHLRGLRVGGHAPAPLRAQEALEQGLDEIGPVNELAADLLAPPRADARSAERITLPAEKAGTLDLSARPVQDWIAALRARGAVAMPALTGLAFIAQRDGAAVEAYGTLAEHLPADVRRSLQAGVMKMPDAGAALRYKTSYTRMGQLAGALQRGGVALAAGSGGLPGFGLQAELAQLVRAGLSPAQALQLATWQAAQLTRTQAERGSVSAGKLADLVLLDGDPTRDIGELARVALVITRGKLIYPHEVDVAMGVTPFVQNPPQLRTVVRNTPLPHP